jgi:hypothetical protein
MLLHQFISDLMPDRMAEDGLVLIKYSWQVFGASVTIDYRWEDGHFLVSTSCVKSLNPVCFPAVKKGANN